MFSIVFVVDMASRVSNIYVVSMVVVVSTVSMIFRVSIPMQVILMECRAPGDVKNDPA